MPLLVSRRVFDTKHFQFFYRHFDFVKNRPWEIIEGKEYVKVKDSWLLKPMGYHLPYMTNLRQLVSPFLRLDAPKKRIFLNRSSKAGRTIRNFEELVPILNAFSFTIIDAAAFTMEEQLALFSSLSHLVAIHGAGNTNLLFSDSSVRFLEIMPANKIASHYYWLSNALGIAYYDILLGDDIKRASSGKETDFNVNSIEFKQKLEKLISE
jgi:capsular polysaccharide biosynthesis protein